MFVSEIPSPCSVSLQLISISTYFVSRVYGFHSAAGCNSNSAEQLWVSYAHSPLDLAPVDLTVLLVAIVIAVGYDYSK